MLTAHMHLYPYQGRCIAVHHVLGVFQRLFNAIFAYQGLSDNLR